MNGCCLCFSRPRQSIVSGALARLGAIAILAFVASTSGSTLAEEGIQPTQITQAGQSLNIVSVPNLRDLGGYQTVEGASILGGLVYRSNQLYHVSPPDMDRISSLGLKYVYDLRTYDEMLARPEELPPNASHVWLDVLADSPQAGPACSRG